MSDSVFMNIIRGNRLSSIVGLEMHPDVPHKFAQDYAYVEIPFSSFYNPTTEEVQTKGTRNQHLRVLPACKINLRGNYRLIVKTNPILQEYGQAPAMFIIDPNDNQQPSFYVTLRKDMDGKELDWAVRMYLIT